MTRPEIAALPAWDGLVPEWLCPDGSVWLSRGPDILKAECLGGSVRKVGTVPLSSAHRAAVTSPLARRLLRLACYNVVPLEATRLLVSFDTRHLVLDTVTGEWSPIVGLDRPFRILRGCCALTPDGDLFFGEYFANRDRGCPVHIYRLARGTSQAERIYTFPAGVIRHIHGVHWDPYSASLWLCAGDLPAECRILRSYDRFKTIHTVGQGDESWRAIQPMFTPDTIFYATDCEHLANAIHAIDRATGERRSLTAIDGPSYYGAQLAGLVLYATTAELCPSQQHPEAALWAIGAGPEPKRLDSFRKDLLAKRALVRLFQPGMVLFPSGERNSSRLPFTGCGLKDLDGRMMVIGSCETSTNNDSPTLNRG